MHELCDHNYKVCNIPYSGVHNTSEKTHFVIEGIHASICVMCGGCFVKSYTLQVAHSLGKQDVAQTWLILKLLYCGTDIECSRLGLVQIKMPSRHTAGSRLSNVQVC